MIVKIESQTASGDTAKVEFHGRAGGVIEVTVKQAGPDTFEIDIRSSHGPNVKVEV